MSPTALELALKKQRLQLAGAGLRTDFARHAGGLRPAFQAADGAVDAARWLYQRPQVLVGIAVALLVARPSRAWRLARRAVMGWQTWRQLRRLLHDA